MSGEEKTSPQPRIPTEKGKPFKSKVSTSKLSVQKGEKSNVHAMTNSVYSVIQRKSHHATSVHTV